MKSAVFIGGDFDVFNFFELKGGGGGHITPKEKMTELKNTVACSNERECAPLLEAFPPFK